MNPHAPGEATLGRAGPETAPGPTGVLSPEQAQAVVRLVEAAPSVHRRAQFFVWTQSQMLTLLPHQVLVCGAYERQRRGLLLDAFNSVVLPEALLRSLTDPASPLLVTLLKAWQAGRGRPLAVALDRLDGDAAEAGAALQQHLGSRHLLLHAVSRPQRLQEIETLFLLAGGGPPGEAEHGVARRCACLELMLPHLHSTWQRVCSTELALQRPVGLAPAVNRLAGAARPAVTGRERQILQWVREGLSNQEIATVLGISPLTVKNHIQKILRKLNAGNRAQAVAQALAQNLIDAAGLAPPPAP